MKKLTGSVSHFELLEPLGKGGMGHVYTAFDKNLKRRVVLKFISPELIQDASIRERFLREARMAAALDHANICTVHEVGEISPNESVSFDSGEVVPPGTPFIVMELIGGKSLESWLSESGLPSRDEFFDMSIQIAEGLEAAHQRGVVHRDLKPANLQLTPDGTIKILDFGLARDHRNSSDTGQGGGGVSTVPLVLTRTGMIMGTPGYMSPEQVRGGVVDWRSDIWAFGCILYEMLTGQRAFPGDTVQDRMVSILEREPDWTSLPEWLPRSIRQMLRRALTKDVKKRLQSAGDARILLQEALAGSIEEPAEQSVRTPAWRRSVPWVGVLLAAVAVWFFRPQSPPSQVPVLRAEIALPEGERLDAFHRRGVAISPDGKNLAFTAGPSPSRWEWPDTARIYLRPMNQSEARAIPGTENGLQPFFSPDSEWLGFIRDGELRKVRLSGYDTSLVCECDASFGASWGSNGTIVFAGSGGGLLRVASSGGEPVPLTELDEDAGEVSHRLPRFLPDGKSVLFTVLRYKTVNLRWDLAQVWVLSLETGERELLIEGGADAAYLPSGHLVFARGDRLMAVRYDASRHAIEGDIVTVLDRVQRSINTSGTERETGVAQFSVSDSGVLAYAAGTTFAELKRVVVSVDRNGQEEALPVESRDYLSVRVSPDGRAALLTCTYPPRDVWLYELDRQVARRQTFEANQTYAIWGPGPDQFTFDSDRAGPAGFYVKAINSGPGEAEKLPISVKGYHRPSSWSPDGKVLAFVAESEAGSFDVLMFTRDGGVAPFLDSPFDELFPEFSPDGRWLIYTSNESGAEEVYVRPWPGPGAATQISRGGGTSPAWARDGREIFYRESPGLRRMYAVGVEVADGRILPQEPVVLFKYGYAAAYAIRRHDVTPDGRLLLIRNDLDAAPLNRDEAFPAHIQVVQGWLQELEEKLR